MTPTRVLRVSSSQPDSNIISEAANVLRRGGLVAFPTETVYGLGADAFNPTAVRGVFEVKRRPVDNPLIVHIAGLEHLRDVADSIPSSAKALAQTFWPGPLTLVLERSANVPDIVTAGLDSVAVRIPDHPVTLELIKEFGRGIVGPSANLSGSPSPTNAEHVYADLNGKIDIILDAGPTEIGVESTIIDVTVEPPVVLRLGGLPLEKIEEMIGRVEATEDMQILNRAPGTRHRHYAPKADVIIIDEGDREAFLEVIGTYAKKRIGCILHSEELVREVRKTDTTIFTKSLDELSRKLYETLRSLDLEGIDVILFEAVPEKGIGAAIMDRVRRASASSIAKEHSH